MDTTPATPIPTPTPEPAPTTPTATGTTTPTSTPSGQQKKLKQMRLPFQPLNKAGSNKHESKASTPIPAKPATPKGKRKPSQEASPQPLTKRERKQDPVSEQQQVQCQQRKSPEMKKHESKSVPAASTAASKPKKRAVLVSLSSKVSPSKRQAIKRERDEEIRMENSLRSQTDADVDPADIITDDDNDNTEDEDMDAAPEEQKKIPTPAKEQQVLASKTGERVKKRAQLTPVLMKRVPHNHSPGYVASCKRKLEVAIAKLDVELNESNAKLDAAVEKQDFLTAAEIKNGITTSEANRDVLKSVLDQHAGDPEQIDSALNKVFGAIKTGQQEQEQRTAAAPSPTIITPKRPSTSVTIVKTPGSISPQPSTSSMAKKLTPRQEAKLAEKARLKEEKERKREADKKEREAKKDAERKEREAKKEAERVEKEKIKKLKEAAKETARKAKEAAKETARKAKEAQKELEKQTRQAERRQKEEEKERKLEEKRQLEEAERIKKEKAAKTFSQFFFKREVLEEQENVPVNSLFTPFRVKTFMRLAPHSRTNFDDSRKQILDSSLRAESAAEKSSYLEKLRSGSYVAGAQGKTWPLEEIRKSEAEEDEVEIVEDDEAEHPDLTSTAGNQLLVAMDDETNLKPTRVHAKLLQFWDNQRPAYWGTWSKKSKFIRPRRPFGRDEKLFDYDYDSGEDWEEEEQGESLSDEEKDDEEDEALDAADDDDDDGFFVGHGVLDKDEIQCDDDDGSDGAVEYDEELETKKQRMRAQAFEEEYKKKQPAKLKPRVFGCLWANDAETQKAAMSDLAYEQLLKVLGAYKAVIITSEASQITQPIATELSAPPPPPPASAKTGDASSSTPSKTPVRKTKEGSGSTRKKSKKLADSKLTTHNASEDRVDAVSPKCEVKPDMRPASGKKSIKSFFLSKPKEAENKPISTPSDTDDIEIIEIVPNPKAAGDEVPASPRSSATETEVPYTTPHPASAAAATAPS